MTVTLPEGPRGKLYALSVIADDADVLARAAAAALKDAQTQSQRLLTALESASNEERAVELRARLEALEKDVARMRETLHARQSRRDADRQMILRLDDWLERLPSSVMIEPVEPPAPERGVTADQLRAEIARIKSEIAAVSQAPLPPSVLKERAREWVREHAERGRPALTVRSGRLSINFRRANPLVPGDALSAVMPPDAVVWLHRDAMTVALDAEIDALGIVGGLTDAERASRLRELNATLLDTERREEALIERARAEGTTIARRSDADPRAVLGIKLVGAAAAVAA